MAISSKVSKQSTAKPGQTIGGGCDEEALRVVKKMPAWYPGYQNGRNVPVRFTLKMDFKIK